MKLIIRILSLMLATVLALSSFASCDILMGKPEDVIADAEAELAKAPYTADIDIEFSTDDPDMQSVISEIRDMHVSLSVNGDDATVSTRISMSDTTVEVDCTFLDEMVYRKDYVKVGNRSGTIYRKAYASDADVKILTEDAAPGSEIDYFDFETVEMQTSGEIKLITCTDVKHESLESIKELLADSLDISSDAISVSELEYIIRIKDGKYDGIYFTCTYSIGISGEVYDVTLRMVTSYDYTTPVEISVPEDTSEYNNVALEEIIDL